VTSGAGSVRARSEPGERSARRSPWRVVPIVVLAVSACSRGPSTLAPVTGVRLRADTVFYDAAGSTRPEWLVSMRSAARRAGVAAPYLAHTEWQTRWSYASARPSPLGCAPQAPLIEVTIRYIMPRLPSESGVARDDMMEWQRHSVSLWRHEEGHALRALRAAAEMRDSLASVRAPRCDMLPGAATRAIAAVMAKYRALQAEYDTRSAHGARQGAILLLPGTTRLSTDTTYRDTIP
jgi:predicted secreted Zn-dependent protease